MNGWSVENGWLRGTELSKHGHKFIWDIAESSWEQKQKDDWRNQALKIDIKNFNLIVLTSMFLRLLVSCVIFIELLNLLFINSFKSVYKSNMHNFNLHIHIYIYILLLLWCLQTNIWCGYHTTFTLPRTSLCCKLQHIHFYG